MTESLYATETRLYQEDGLLGAPVVGSVIEPPLTGAAAARRVIRWESSTTPFRVPATRSPIHQAYQLRTSHELNPWLLAWILKRHMVLDSGTYYLDREAPDPSFTLQLRSEDGDLIQFKGAVITELQVVVTERGIATLELTWAALERQVGNSLWAADTTTDTELLASNDCAAALVSGSLNADTRADAIDAFQVNLFLRRPGLQAVNYDPTGIPTAYTRAPWRVVGELIGPWGALADTAAADRIDGAFGLLLGLDGSDLDLRFTEAAAFVSQDPIKADDFRQATFLIEVGGDSRGSLLELIDNL